MQGIRGSLDVISLVHALMGYPKALLYPVLRRALSHSIESPRVMNYLTKPSEEEIQMIHPSKVYASKSSIPKVSCKGRSNRSNGESRQPEVRKGLVIKIAGQHPYRNSDHAARAAEK